MTRFEFIIWLGSGSGEQHEASSPLLAIQALLSSNYNPRRSLKITPSVQSTMDAPVLNEALYLRTLSGPAKRRSARSGAPKAHYQPAKSTIVSFFLLIPMKYWPP